MEVKLVVKTCIFEGDVDSKFRRIFLSVSKEVSRSILIDRILKGHVLTSNDVTSEPAPGYICFLPTERHLEKLSVAHH